MLLPAPVVTAYGKRLRVWSKLYPGWSEPVSAETQQTQNGPSPLERTASPIPQSCLLGAGLPHIKVSGAGMVRQRQEKGPLAPDPVRDKTLQPRGARGYGSHQVGRALLTGLTPDMRRKGNQDESPFDGSHLSVVGSHRAPSHSPQSLLAGAPVTESLPGPIPRDQPHSRPPVAPTLLTNEETLKQGQTVPSLEMHFLHRNHAHQQLHYPQKKYAIGKNRFRGALQCSLLLGPREGCPFPS